MDDTSNTGLCNFLRLKRNQPIGQITNGKLPSHCLYWANAPMENLQGNRGQ